MSEPIYKVKEGNISASVFKNEKGYSVNVQKSYQKDNEWVNKSVNLFFGEIKNLDKVLVDIQRQYRAEIEADAKKAEAIRKKKEN